MWRRRVVTAACDEERRAAATDDREDCDAGPPAATTLTAARLLDESLGVVGEGFGRRRDCLRDGATLTSTMLDVHLDTESTVPLHEQVASEIRRALVDEQCAPGERLPPARDLAAVLGVNRNTVLRALRDLRDEGLLEFRRGRGVTVAGSPDRTAVVARARDLLRFARTHGYRRADLINLIEHLP
jgi:GntR family transcriptional regulator